MGKAWMGHPSWELVEEASDTAGRDVAKLLLTADTDELTQTRNSQLATFVMSMMVLDSVTRIGIEAAGHVGHSLGEYSALTSAGVLDFKDTVKLVTERGEAMQFAAEERPGTMAAVIGLDDEAVQIACNRAALDVWVANHNSLGQTVVAGAPEAIKTACVIARELGAKRVIELQVNGAFHTPFMASARERLAKAIERTEFRDPCGTVIANIDATVHNKGSDWPDLLKAQLTSPVRWRQTLSALDSAGFDTFIELGPGKVLSGLVKRTLKGSKIQSVSIPEHLNGLLESLVPSPHTGTAASTDTATPFAQLAIEGEHTFTTERLIVSPSAGVFTPVEGLALGTHIEVGHLLGQVGSQTPGQEVRSAFSGTLMGVLAVTGERVTTCQPIAWLRTH